MIADQSLDVIDFMISDIDFFTGFLYSWGNRRNDVLWELYGHEPCWFIPLADQAAELQLKDRFRLDWIPSTGIQTFPDAESGILKYWLNSEYPRLSAVSRQILSIQTDWHHAQGLWNSLGMVLGYRIPFQTGLEGVCNTLYLHALDVEASHVLNFMESLPDQPGTSSSPGDLTGSESIFFLLAPAGSGKTQQIFDRLSTRLGFYLVSGAVPREGNGSTLGDDILYAPRSAGASADTCLLYRMVAEEQFEDSACAFLCHQLVLNRLNLLFRVLRQALAAGRLATPDNPWRWLQFQLSCGTRRDSFERLLRLMVLSGSRIITFEEDRSSLSGNESINYQKLLWCIDEVQEDLPERNKSDYGYLRERTGFLEVVLHQIFSKYGPNGDDQEPPQTVLSGTAMNFKRIRGNTQEAIASVEELYKFPPFPVHDLQNPNTRVHTSKIIDLMALVNTGSKFSSLFQNRLTTMFSAIWAILDSRNPQDQNWIQSAHYQLKSLLMGNGEVLFDQNFFDAFDNLRKYYQDQTLQQIRVRIDKVSNIIEKYAIPLRGRYRWSVCYIEYFFRLAVMSEDLSEEHISKAYSRARALAMNPLLVRIQALHGNPSQRSLFMNLTHMALDADLFGRSRVLHSPEDSDDAAKLVEQAIGHLYVKTKDNEQAAKVCLAERLVVDAVIEYLKPNSLLTSEIDRYLNESQHEVSNFGFGAEEKLALEVYQQTSLPHRSEFLKRLEPPRFLQKRRKVPKQLNQKQFGLGDYVLEVNWSESTFDRQILDNGDLSDWLQRVYQGRPRATFLLPDKLAGPDVVFVLKKDNPAAPKLICAIQVSYKLSINHI
jgi:hypothetical protein